MSQTRTEPETIETVPADPENALPMRVASGPARWVYQGLALAISLVCLAFVLDLTFVLRVRFFQEQYFGLLYGLVFAAGFLRAPATSAGRGRARPPRPCAR